MKVLSPANITAFLVFSASAILNYFGSSPRILYLPAFALCVWIMYQTHAYVSHKEATKNLLKPNTVSEERPTNIITSHGQRGGFTGINEGTVNLGPPPPVPINFPDEKVELLKSMLAVPTIESIDFVRYSDADSENLYNKLRYAFASWRIPNLAIVNVALPPLESGVTVRYGDAHQSTQVDAIVKALRDVGLPARKLDSRSNGGNVTIQINGLSTTGQTLEP
jgi:hypothetical protein